MTNKAKEEKKKDADKNKDDLSREDPSSKAPLHSAPPKDSKIKLSSMQPHMASVLQELKSKQASKTKHGQKDVGLPQDKSRHLPSRENVLKELLSKQDSKRASSPKSHEPSFVEEGNTKNESNKAHELQDFQSPNEPIVQELKSRHENSSKLSNEPPPASLRRQLHSRVETMQRSDNPVQASPRRQIQSMFIMPESHLVASPKNQHQERSEQFSISESSLLASPRRQFQSKTSTNDIPMVSSPDRKELSGLDQHSSPSKSKQHWMRNTESSKGPYKTVTHTVQGQIPRSETEGLIDSEHRDATSEQSHRTEYALPTPMSSPTDGRGELPTTQDKEQSTSPSNTVSRTNRVMDNRLMKSKLQRRRELRSKGQG